MGLDDFITGNESSSSPDSTDSVDDVELKETSQLEKPDVDLQDKEDIIRGGPDPDRNYRAEYAEPYFKECWNCGGKSVMLDYLIKLGTRWFCTNKGCKLSLKHICEVTASTLDTAQVIDVEKAHRLINQEDFNPAHMGLDDFKSDDENGSNSTNNTDQRTADQSSDNSPSHVGQAFSDNPSITPRDIKYQVKGGGAKWGYSFSRMRFEQGELVMYSAGLNVHSQGKAVLVFTTIQPITSDLLPDHTEDIRVVEWDLEASDNIGEDVYISPEDGWREELYDTVYEKIQSLND